MKKAFLLLLLFVFYSPTFGQLGFCTGSKGAPIFNENFGSGAGYGPQLPAGTTSYIYTNAIPVDGQYTLFTNTNGFNGSWHNSVDHTPDNEPNGFNGKMLIVNASFTAGEFYKRTVTGLCVNTTFEFSAWLMNVFKSNSGACSGTSGIPVNVRFEIWDATETTLLQSGNTNNINGTPTPIWTQYGLVFTTGPAQTSVVLKMKNNGVGGCGNDLAIDDIVFRSCGASTAVTISPSASNSYYACQNELPFNLLLQATTSATTPQVYQWQQSSDNLTWTSITGQNGSTYSNNSVNTTTYFRVKVAQDLANLTNDFCSTISDIFTFGTYPAVSTPISNGNPIICSNTNTTPLSVSAPTNTTINWYDAPVGGVLVQSNSVTFTPSVAGIYYAEAISNSTGCASARIPVELVLSAPPVVTISETIICNGATTLTALPNTVATYSYAWTVPAGATNPGDVASFSTTVAGNYSVIITNTTTTCVSASASSTVTINPIPTVSVNSGSFCSNSTTTITATPGIAGTYSYAWTVPSGVINPGNVSSFTTNTAGTYSVIITDTVSTCSSSSASGIVTVNPSPVVSLSSGAFCAGGTTTLTATPAVTGTYTYTWSVPTGAIDPGNATTITSGIEGTYSVVITDPISFCSSASASGSITANPLPLVTVNSQTICVGSSALVVATPSIAAIYSYAWTVPTGVTNPGDVASFSTTVAGNYNVIITNTITTCVSAVASGTINSNVTSIISGNTTICQGLTSQLTGSAMPATTNPWVSSNTAVATIDDTGLVTGITAGTTTITFTNSNGCSVSTIVDVKNIPTVSVNSSVACLGATVTITATPSSLGLFSYTWTVPSGVSPPGDVASFATSVAGTYSVIITDTVTNCSSLSASGTVTLNPIPTVVATPNVQAICSGQAIGVVFSSNLSGTTFSWTVNQIDATGATPSSGTILSEILTATGGSPGTVTYTILPNSNGCVGIPTNLVVTVTPKPTVVATPSSETICSGNSTNIQLTSNLSNTTFSWNAVQISSTGASASSGTSINQTLTTLGNAGGQAAYSITPISNGCPGTPIVVDIFVNPIPIGNASPTTQIICSGQTTAISLSSNVAGTQFNWTSSANGATGDFASSGNNIAQTLTTLSLSQGTVVYTVSPSANGCNGTPIVVTVDINPIPEAFSSATAIICSGQTTTIPITANLTNTSFTWTVTQNGVTGASAGTSTTISQLLIAPNGVGTAIYEITPSLNGCFGLPITTTVTVNPLPKPTLVGGVICVDQASQIAFQTYTLDSGLNASDYSFVWTLDGTVLATSTSSTHTATTVGVYGVTATNTATGCVSNEVLTGITSTFPGLTVTTEQTFYFDNNATVSVIVTGGNGTYLYQLDTGVQQSSPTFSGLTFGNHTIYVTDTDGCTSLSTTILIVDYPHFFTPNGDGINDTWLVNSLNSDAKIYIFDRTGRLLKQISPEGLGWDGTFVGNKLPADDYWFTIEYIELGITKIFKSHFTLKR